MNAVEVIHDAIVAAAYVTKSVIRLTGSALCIRFLLSFLLGLLRCLRFHDVTWLRHRLGSSCYFLNHYYRSRCRSVLPYHACVLLQGWLRHEALACFWCLDRWKQSGHHLISHIFQSCCFFTRFYVSHGDRRWQSVLPYHACVLLKDRFGSETRKIGQSWLRLSKDLISLFLLRRKLSYDLCEIFCLPIAASNQVLHFFQSNAWTGLSRVESLSWWAHLSALDPW